jgi:DNA polymerase III subunit epsilon
MYAIVDIETTGGYAANNDITELAIVLHDGIKVVERFETLVRPTAPIPYFIQVLTGITHEMVASAPPFHAVAEKVYSLLKDNIFIAHNVNFDYSFLKHHLSLEGFELDCQKICTVRLTKKVFPGLQSYSLGNLCRHFGIPIVKRHRAGGDADGTVRLLETILANNGEIHIAQSLKKGSKEQCLPPNLPREQVEGLPYSPGVYYFHDHKGKIIYVGKAKNIKYRVSSHFTHNGAGRQRQDFLRNIHSISYTSCSTELMAFILESLEIRKHWPPFNYSQKRFQANFGLYVFEDMNGYLRLAIEKQRKSLQPVYTFGLITEGHRLLTRLIQEFNLCPKLCFLQTSTDACTGSGTLPCLGACEKSEAPGEYNLRVQMAVSSLETTLPTFAVLDEGHTRDEQCCILIEKGRFYGMGYVPSGITWSGPSELKNYLKEYPENDYIRNLVYQYIHKRPEKKLEFSK